MNPEFDYQSGFLNHSISFEEVQTTLDALIAFSVAEKRPELNGVILQNTAGTRFTVVDGVAKGWRSWSLYRRLHPKYLHKLRKVTDTFGRGGWTYFDTPVQKVPSMNFIDLGDPWSDNVMLVRNSAGTVSIYEEDTDYPEGRLYGVPSPSMMMKYKLDWYAIHLIPDVAYNSYPMPVILR